jgi:imidazolonepropionase
MSAVTLWLNGHLALCDGSMQRVEAGALVTREDRIEWVGRADSVPTALRAAAAEERDLGGAWVTPGLIDCHTHLVFAGTRAAEYAERLRGVSYEDIARRGGGILSTVRATRAASESELYAASVPRLESLLAEGVTCLEVKSGYGLTLADEAKMLRVARRLSHDFPVRIRTTLLAAHAVPPEYTGRPDEYVDAIVERWLPELQESGLVDAVDIFCESVAFDTAQAERLLRAAVARGVPVKMHAEQLANIGASRLAARYGALSCDHLEYAGEEEAQALAAAGTVAVLLPVAFYCLAATRKPPVAALRAAGTRIAVASDSNPGSAPGASLLLALNMSTRLFGLTAGEALAGTTCHAARALGLHADLGSLEVGRLADFAVWDIATPEELGYWVGYNRCRAVVSGGKVVRGAIPLSMPSTAKQIPRQAH